MNKKEMPLVEHFRELRTRFILSFVVFIIVFCICYYFSEPIYHFLLAPLAELEKNNTEFSLIYTGLTEAFFVYLKVASLAALFASSPFFYMAIIPFYCAWAL